ncbi:type IV secretion system protein [candidate division KSB1 bacterium]
MKKIIFISLIIALLYIPVSFGVDSQDGILQPSIANAQGAINPETTTLTKRELTKRGLEKDDDGIIRSSDTVSDAFENGINALMERIALLPIFISSFFVFVAGTLLNVSVLETVIKLGEHFNAVQGIDSAWGVLRDLANIFFIFGLLTIAISTIVGLSGYGYKQLLAKLIIVALIINFSLFFTKFVIDTSNIFALQFYQGASVTDRSGATGIANTFMQHLGVTSLWETDEVLKTLNELNYSETGGFGLMFLYSIFTSIFLMITAFVFMFAAIMLIVRAVGFILLAILSPLAFAALILPRTKGLANQWWEKLWQYAIFAPVLLMLFWVIATIIPSITATFVTGNAELLGALSSNPQARSASIGMILNFIILISLMLASIIISNKLSMDFGKQATKLAGKATFGALGAAGRGTVGRGFSKLSQSEGLKEAAAGGGAGGFAARLALRTTRAGAKANYDLRSAPGVAAGTKDFGIDLGKGQKGGYEAILKKQIEDRKKFAGSLAPSPIAQAEAVGAVEKGKKALEGQKGKFQKDLKIATNLRDEAQKKHKKSESKYGAADSRTTDAQDELQKAQKSVSDTEAKIKYLEMDIGETEKRVERIKGFGKKRAEKYAETLASEKTIDTLFTMIPRKNKEAAVAIKKGKSDEDKVMGILEKQYKKKKDEEEPKDSAKPEGKDEGK